MSRTINSSPFPDLLVHDRLYPLLGHDRFELDAYFNVIRVRDLRPEPARVDLLGISANSVDRSASTVRLGDRRWDTNRAGVMQTNISLVSHYDQLLQSGHDPSITSYFFDGRINLYQINRRLPRYVIWTKSEPLPVCATVVDRVDHLSIGTACSQAIQWATSFINCGQITPQTDMWENMAISSRAQLNQTNVFIKGGGCNINTINQITNESVVVFDLDRTLIDDDKRLFAATTYILQAARQRFDKMVLWSHGSHLHVDECVRYIIDTIQEEREKTEFETIEESIEVGNGAIPSATVYNRFDTENLFDLVLSNDTSMRKSPKNLLHLYNYFPRSRFTKALLVDDSVFNWTPEYTRMLVPISSDVRAAVRIFDDMFY